MCEIDQENGKHFREMEIISRKLGTLPEYNYKQFRNRGISTGYGQIVAMFPRGKALATEFVHSGPCQ